MTTPNTRLPRFSLPVLLASLALACGPDAPAVDPAPAGAAEQGASAVEMSAPIVANGLSIALPSTWNQVPPQSRMRMLEAEIPGSAGAGQISMYYFPGGAGGAAANIERWKGQVVLETGDPEPVAQSRESDGVRRTWIELEGTVKASTIGSFPSTDQPGFALYGAVIEAPGGPWFARAVGPAATMREQRQAFLAMLDSARSSQQ